jgi:histidinol phosphatase-like enzyme
MVRKPHVVVLDRDGTIIVELCQMRRLRNHLGAAETRRRLRTLQLGLTVVIKLTLLVAGVGTAGL